MTFDASPTFLFSQELYGILRNEETVAEFRDEVLEYLKKKADHQAILVLVSYIIECHSIASCELQTIIFRCFESIVTSIESFTQESCNKIYDKYRKRLNIFCHYFSFNAILHSNTLSNLPPITKSRSKSVIKVKRTVEIKELIHYLIKYSKRSSTKQFIKKKIKEIEKCIEYSRTNQTPTSSISSEPTECHLLDLIIDDNE